MGEILACARDDSGTPKLSAMGLLDFAPDDGRLNPLQQRQMSGERILGIEGGGTKTAWALIADDAIIESGKLAPSNLRLTPPHQIEKIFRVLPGEVDRVGVFLAGCATEEDRAVLLKLTRAVWRMLPHR